MKFLLQIVDESCIKFEGTLYSKAVMKRLPQYGVMVRDNSSYVGDEEIQIGSDSTSLSFLGDLSESKKNPLLFPAKSHSGCKLNADEK